jgi:hypothetical protein
VASDGHDEVSVTLIDAPDADVVTRAGMTGTDEAGAGRARNRRTARAWAAAAAAFLRA